MQAPDNKTKTEELIQLTQHSSNNILYNGYLGAAKMIMAKHYFNPWEKYKSFQEGKKILESSLKKDYQNPELRFLRLSIQNNAPSFLNYNENINEDKDFLFRKLNLMNDAELKFLIQLILKK